MCRLTTKLSWFLQRYGFRGFLSEIIYRFVGESVRHKLLSRSIKHISGAKAVAYAKDELVVVCLVRNGAHYLHSFVRHYLELGVKHIVFLDNVSTDETIALAASYDCVTVIQSSLPFKRYKSVMRRYLLRRFGNGRWCLCVDIDEFFDYPFSDQLSLADFLGYLNEYDYTAVVAQMLDMFAASPLQNNPETIQEAHQYYDISDLVKLDYYARNTIANEAIKVHFGGIRKTVFAIDKIKLTKHPLIFYDDHIKPVYPDSHEVRRAKIADITAVLRHYKFLGDFYQRLDQAIREENYYNNSAEYKQYAQILTANPELELKQSTAQKYNNVQTLIEAEFLVVSSAYEKWVQQHKSHEKAPPPVY